MSDTLYQFERYVRVQVNTLAVEGLRVMFHVKKTDKVEPNTADISIFNLAPDSRSKMQTKWAKVVLAAGYRKSTIAQIFAGDARTVDHLKGGRSGKDPVWESRVRCGDGEHAYQFGGYSKSFAPGVTVSYVLADIIKNFGLDVGNSLQRANAGNLLLTTFASGVTLHGRVSDALQKVAAAAGLEFSIQDGALQILGENEALKGPVVLISPTTGLVGAPDHGAPQKQGEPSMLRVKCLLSPQLRPGARFKLQSASLSGYYRCRVVTHTGDTHGGDWYSLIEATPA